MLRLGLGAGLTKRHRPGARIVDFNLAQMSALPSSLTFSRFGPATYINSAGLIASAADGVARMGAYAPGGTVPGILMEGARTNLCLRSQDFATTWARLRVNAFGSGSVVNATTAPDGTSTADFICEDTNNDTHFIRQAVTVSSGVAHTFSVYAKAGTRSIVTVGESATTLRTATFDLSAGTVSNVGGSITATITALADGWYRCAITYTTASTTFNADIGIRTTSGAGFQTYTGDGASGLYLWGAQLEAGTFPSSYIPTTGSTAARSVETCYLTLTSAQAAILSVGGTMVVEYTLLGGDSSFSSGGRIYASLNDAGATNQICIYNGSGSSALFVTASGSGGSQAFVPVGTTIPANTKKKCAATWKANSFNFAQGGTSGTRDPSGVVPPGMTTLYVTSSPTWGSAYAIIHRITIYANSTESDTALAALST